MSDDHFDWTYSVSPEENERLKNSQGEYKRSEAGVYPLLESMIPLGDGENPSSEQIPVRYIDVNGREEHEAMLKDEAKMISLGLDPTYEKIIYLKRWGSWLANE